MAPPPSPGSAPEVTAKDQELINEFNRLHQRRDELEAAARARRADESDAADAVEEVSTAYLVADDEEDGSEPPVRFVVGECFLHATSEEGASRRAEAAREEAAREAEAAAREEREVSERMKELKATLYSKFGGSINLEA